eukprot:IDg23765t1
MFSGSAQSKIISPSVSPRIAYARHSWPNSFTGRILWGIWLNRTHLANHCNFDPSPFLRALKNHVQYSFLHRIRNFVLHCVKASPSAMDAITSICRNCPLLRSFVCLW